MVQDVLPSNIVGLGSTFRMVQVRRSCVSTIVCVIECFWVQRAVCARVYKDAKGLVLFYH